MWKAERFSWGLTRLMPRFPEDRPFERAMQVAELDSIAVEPRGTDQHCGKLHRAAGVMTTAKVLPTLMDDIQ